MPKAGMILACSVLLGLSAAWANEAVRLPILAGGPFSVRVVKDIAYYEGEDADPQKHKLNLYLPVGAKEYPVVLFLHGGGWRTGDRNFLFDVYGKLGNHFAKNGVALAVASYRLSPKVQHPEHVKDAARAFSWVKRHIADYGADAARIFVAGHSAGGHLASLLATDETYLKECGHSRRDVGGVVGISGVYEVAPDKRFFPSVFPLDTEVRKQASPIHHVCAELPPMLLIYGDRDFPTLDRLAVRFHAELTKQQVDCECLEVKQRDHFSILGLMLEQDDPGFQAIIRFLARHSTLELKPADAAPR